METIFHFTRIGALVKVTAIDTQTGTEVMIQGPASTPQTVLQKTAADKLRYVMEKKEQERKKGPPAGGR